MINLNVYKVTKLWTKKPMCLNRKSNWELSMKMNEKEFSKAVYIEKTMLIKISKNTTMAAS